MNQIRNIDMTKKHYEAIAKVIRENLGSVSNSNFYYDFVSELCRIFYEFNSKFDSDKFRQACKEE
jgi:hypothetical protein